VAVAPLRNEAEVEAEVVEMDRHRASPTAKTVKHLAIGLETVGTNRNLDQTIGRQS